MPAIQRRFPLAHVLSRLLHVFLGAAFVTVTARSTAAQELSGLREGARVKIDAVGTKHVVGVVKSISPDSTTLFIEGNGGTLGLANANIKGISVSRGRTTMEGFKKGTMWGGAVGAGLAAAIALSINSDPNYQGKESTTSYVTSIALGGMFWGAIIGSFTKAEKWDRLLQ